MPPTDKSLNSNTTVNSHSVVLRRLIWAKAVMRGRSHDLRTLLHGAQVSCRLTNPTPDPIEEIERHLIPCLKDSFVHGIDWGSC